MNKLFVNNEEKKILVKEKYEGNIYQYGSTMNDIKPSIILNSKEKWSKVIMKMFNIYISNY